MRLRGARLGSMVGAIGGVLFVLINAGGLPASPVLRIVGLVGFVVTAVAIARAPDREDMHQPGSLRTYWVSVVAMVVGLIVGSVLLRVVDHDNLQLAWVVLMVGLHFLPFSRAFGAPLFLGLAGALVLVALVGGAATLAGWGDASGWTGVVAGFVLIGYALAGVVTAPSGATGSPYAGRGRGR